MQRKIILISIPAFALLIAPLAMAGRGDTPPPDSAPLSAIIKAVEGKNLGAITDVEFDDGLWEVKVCAAGACQKLYLEPATGDETRRKKAGAGKVPPENAMPLSSIIESVEARDMGRVTDVEFDHGVWEVKLRKDKKKSRLKIDPVTGETRPK